jgi:hypothetical protein
MSVKGKIAAGITVFSIIGVIIAANNQPASQSKTNITSDTAQTMPATDAALEATDTQTAADAATEPETLPQPEAPEEIAETPSEPAAQSNNCDPNYSSCVPIASDVDCAGGSGNGPAYVRGPVQVTGSDIYGLDRDGNGVGCE